MTQFADRMMDVTCEGKCGRDAEDTPNCLRPAIYQNER
jgi:hypothetical protein